MIFFVKLDDLKGKLTLRDGTGLVHRATVVCTMSHGAGLPWLCMWAWVSLRPWIFSQLFFSTSVFFFSIDWQTGRGGQWKACTPEEASVCVSVWYMPLFHVDHCQFGVQCKAQEAEPWLTHLYVFNLSAFKVSSGRKRDAWKRQIKLTNSSRCENIQKKKKKTWDTYFNVAKAGNYIRGAEMAEIPSSLSFFTMHKNLSCLFSRNKGTLRVLHTLGVLPYSDGA